MYKSDVCLKLNGIIRSRTCHCGNLALDLLTNCNFAKKLLGLFREVLKPTVIIGLYS